MPVYFLGAGPGDAELITLKAKRILESADVVIYAGSLINPRVLKHSKKGAKLYDSSKMNLGEIVSMMKKAHREGRCVARLHSGDPSIYGAMNEQIAELEKSNIPYEVIPGVSSFLAAAAALKKELTVPEVSQTVIVTRLSGRTKVPEKESLAALATHRAAMCIFLSAGMVDEVVDALRAGYEESAPVATVYKASWKEEKIILGTLRDIAAKLKRAKIDRTAIILIGDFLKPQITASKLYSKNFSHSFRRGK